jgi:transcriptional regulator with XRE-family HTH domain
LKVTTKVLEMNITKIVELAIAGTTNKTMQAVADELNVRFQTVHRWKTAASFPTVEHAHKLAILAGLDPVQVIADVLIQSEKRPEVKTTLERIKSLLSKAAIAIPALLISVHQCILCKIAFGRPTPKPC